MAKDIKRNFFFIKIREKGILNTFSSRKMEKISWMLARYLIILIVAFPSLFLFYFLFTSLTIYSSFFLINLGIPASLIGNQITTPYGIIELIDACIAGSAYYLLFLLNLSLPMKTKKRVQALIFSLLAFLAVNIMRIFLFSLLFFGGFAYFSTAHLLVWYGASTLLVVAIWIAEARIFKIQEIPVYTDMQVLIREMRKNRHNS